MVVRDTLLMANLHGSIETGEPVVSNVRMVQTPHDVSTNESASATLPYDSNMGHDSLQPLVVDDRFKMSNCRTHHGLRILTSMRGSSLAGTRVASTDGGRSEDDDGYCSRSSLDSPIQSVKQDSAILGTDSNIVSGAETSDVCDPKHERALQSHIPPLRRTNRSEATASCLIDSVDDDRQKLSTPTVNMSHGTNDGQVAATVASLDHSYLQLASLKVSAPNSAKSVESVIAVSKDIISTADVPTSDKTSVRPLVHLFGGTTKNVNNGRRNVSFYVMPKAVHPVGTANQREARVVEVTCVTPRAIDSLPSRWNGQLYNNITEPHRNMVRKNSVNRSHDRPVGLSLFVADTSSSAFSSVPGNCVNGLSSSSDNHLVKSSPTTRPDQYKPGISTGRCRIGLSDGSRCALGAVAHQKGATSARTGSMYVRTGPMGRGLSANGTHNRAANRIVESSLRLHPLVDHDYGAFATFNAEIQSSIISTTTDGASQLDWRSVRKNRLNRVKNFRAEAPEIVSPQEHCKITGVVETPQATFQVRQKRKYCRRQPVSRDVATASIPKLSRGSKMPGRKGRPPLSESRRLSLTRKRSVSDASANAACSGSQNFVKIPGCYQDEYIYYATKRTRGRPRKLVEPANSLQSPADLITASSKSSSSINVFDWYREMAHTDKTSRFGTSCQPPPSSVSQWTPAESQTSADNGTPADESAVADLVMEMLPKTEIGGIGKDFRSVPLSCGEDFSAAAGTFAISSDRGELAVTEEEVCAVVLQTLNEDDLKMIETQLGVSSENSTQHTTVLDSSTSVEHKTLPSVSGEASFTQYLGDYSRDNLLSLSQASAVAASSGLLDVDDINDSDLLSTDLDNMSVLLSDLSTPTREVRDSNIPAISRSNLSSLFDMPSASAAGIVNTIAEAAGPKQVENCLPVASPPELTNVNMFWNDLPGLMIEGQDYVRLVDIHRQMLPAKDTGILKKRCQMLGLNVRLCTELQRDFLIRYMNAAKSKSTAIVSRPDAIELIGFYVNPKSKTSRVDDSEAGKADTSVNVSKDKAVLPQTSSVNSTIVEQSAAQTEQSLPTSMPEAETDQEQNRNSVVEPHNSASPTDSLANVKRSERLRDKHVRYADMVLGINFRHSSDESELINSQQSPCLKMKKNDVVEATSPKPKHRRTSGDVRVDNDEKTGRVRASSDSGTRSVFVIHHSHRTRLASASESVAPAENSVLNETASNDSRRDNCDSNDIHPQADVKPTTLLSKPTCIELAKRVEETREHVSNNRPSSLQQRAYKLHARRRRRIATLKKRVKVISAAHHVTSSVSRSCWPNENTSLTVVCEDFKENLNVEGHVADNADTSRIKREMVDTVANSSEALESRSSSPVILEINPVTSAIISTKTESSSCVERPVRGPPVKRQPSNVIEIRHCDVQSRYGRRRRSQNGCILLDQYCSPDAKCVRCDTCGELFSIASFVAHLHRGSNVDQLIAVNSLQMLEPRGLRNEEWEHFERLTAQLLAGNTSVDCSADNLELPAAADDSLKTALVTASVVRPVENVRDSIACRVTSVIEQSDTAADTEPLCRLSDTTVVNDVTDTKSLVTISERHSERMMRKRTYPLAETKQDAVSRDTRGHLRPSNRRRVTSQGMTTF